MHLLILVCVLELLTLLFSLKGVPDRKDCARTSPGVRFVFVVAEADVVEVVDAASAAAAPARRDASARAVALAIDSADDVAANVANAASPVLFDSDVSNIIFSAVGAVGGTLLFAASLLLLLFVLLLLRLMLLLFTLLLLVRLLFPLVSARAIEQNIERILSM